MKANLLPAIALFVISALLCKAQGPTLWGMTSFGGVAPNDSGTIISYNITSSTETVQHHFCCGTDGHDAIGTPVRANNGLLYGVTFQGGPFTVDWGGTGLIFSFDMSTGNYIVLHDFGTDDTAGTFPSGSLILANNGLLYGMTEGGGADTFGTIFSYDISDGSYVVLHDFGRNSGFPTGSLIQANNGLLYGMTSDGGSSDSGTIFSYNITTATETVLHNFAGPDGSLPSGSLFQANDSLLYGMTTGGGQNNNGILFSYNIATDTFKDIHDFGAGTDGSNPTASLIQATDSLLYGMTPDGGMYGGGIIFSYNISTNTYTDLHDFGNGNDGVEPEGALFQASNGLLYGMTYSGGVNIWTGVIFDYNISTDTELVLHTFAKDSDGIDPWGNNFIEVDDTTADISQLVRNNGYLQIYPNPTTGQFTIQLPGSPAGQAGNQYNYPLEIYNVLGKKIEQTILTNTQNILNLSNQAAGMYFIYVKTEKEVAVGKVIIAK